MASAASLLKIIYTGMQDTRLLPPKGKPAINFFKKVFIKSGRFTTSWVRLDFDTTPKFGTQATITLPRQGHLISRLYLVSTMPDIAGQCIKAQNASATFIGPRFGWTNSLGHAIINNASISIGGAKVEELNGQMMEVLDEFNTPLEKVTVVNTLLPRLDNGFGPQSIGWDPRRPTVAVTPLPFWFSRGDPGVVYPIDAVGNDATIVSITFSPLTSLYVSSAQQTFTTTNPVQGSAYFSLLNSPFYQTANPTTTVYGLTGNPSVGTAVSKIPGITMPTELLLGDTYIMAEYIYLDKPEANLFRLSDIHYPIPQHYVIPPVDTMGLPYLSIPLRIPNPTRDIFFFAQRLEAIAYNAPFLATRDISGFGTGPIWWPNATGLNALYYDDLIPGFSTYDSEPLQTVSLIYNGRLTRYTNQCPAIFRSLIPSYNQRKSPWVNRYYYNMSFGINNGEYPGSVPTGEANLDKVEKLELQLQFQPNLGSINQNNVPRYNIFVFAETYNILRVYGGRAGLLFSY